eukprot:COSAG01_NODE_1959_length_8800_cov_81.221584_1_plen_594_part_00
MAAVPDSGGTGVVRVLLLLLLAAGCAAVVKAMAGVTPPAPPPPLLIDLTTPAHVTAAAFLGVNIDTASLYQGTQPHRLDFTNPALRTLAKAFTSAGAAGTTLRIGGSTADDTVFGVAQPPNAVAIDAGYWDSMIQFADEAGFELTWDLNAMGNSNSLRMPGGGWNASNARLLLKHVATNEQQRVLKSLQLGNEPGHWTAEHAGAPGAAAHGRDYLQLRALLAQLFPARSDVAAIAIAGPDVCFGKFLNCSVANCTSGADKCASLAYFETLLKAADGAIDHVTVHNYGLSGPSSGPPYVPHECSLRNLLTPALWELDHQVSSASSGATTTRKGMLSVLKGWRQVQMRAAPQSKLILSETATAGDGGCVNLSNTFVSGFFWIDQLGLSSESGYWKVYRQDLVGFSGINGGSSYALLGPPGWVGGAQVADRATFLGPAAWPTGHLQANPDYFTSLLWKRLMGQRVLSSSLGATSLSATGLAKLSGVRVYASCADGIHAGNVSLAFLNPSSHAAVITLPDPLHASASMLWELRTAQPGKLDSQMVRLNSGPVLTNANATGGGMAGKARPPSRTLLLQGFTYGFAMFSPPEPVPACKI